MWSPGAFLRENVSGLRRFGWSWFEQEESLPHAVLVKAAARARQQCLASATCVGESTEPAQRLDGQELALGSESSGGKVGRVLVEPRQRLGGRAVEGAPRFLEHGCLAGERVLERWLD